MFLFFLWPTLIYVVKRIVGKEEEDDASSLKGSSKFYKVIFWLIILGQISSYRKVKILPLHLGPGTPEHQYVEWPMDDVFRSKKNKILGISAILQESIDKFICSWKKIHQATIKQTIRTKIQYHRPFPEELWADLVNQ